MAPRPARKDRSEPTQAQTQTAVADAAKRLLNLFILIPA